MPQPYPIKVASPLGEDKFIFRSLTGTEELGRPFELTLQLYSTDPAIAIDQILGQNVTVFAAFASQRSRYFNGDVAEFRQLTRVHTDKYVYEVVLRPKLWFLSHTGNCRIFQNQSAKEIIKAVLDEHGLTDVQMSLSETYETREYCVQYNESYFAFISRLMEEEGIYYYFKHENGKHTLVLADSISAHDKIGGAAGDGSGKVPYLSPRIGYAKDHIDDWTLRQRVQSGVFAHRNFNFEQPSTDLTAQSQISRSHGHAGLEVFRYPGPHLAVDPGSTVARRRIEELHTDWEVVSGNTNSDEFAAGKLFTLDGYELREDQNREHLLTRTVYDIQMETDVATGEQGPVEGGLPGVTFKCRFEAIDSQRPFRPASLTPRPIVRGPQTAIVVGKSGEEIWTDQYGRVKVQFHWDRLGEKNENSSCWLRVAQLWAGKNFGFQQIPRIGDEVIVDFLEGDPDRPIIVGRVYNGENLPPYALPDNQTQSGILTRSSKQGDAATFNELRFEDKKGEEQIYFHAEKNFDRVVENNDTLKVGFEKKDPGDQTIDIYNNRTVTLEEGNEKLQVKKGSRDTIIDKGNDSHEIKEGNRVVTIGQGDDTLTISQGNLTIKIEQAKGSIEACTELLLKVGESSVLIKPDSITISSVNVKVEASGNLEAKGTNSKLAGSAALDLDGGMISLN